MWNSITLFGQETQKIPTAENPAHTHTHTRERATHTCLPEASPKVILYYRLLYNDLKEVLYS